MKLLLLFLPLITASLYNQCIHNKIKRIRHDLSKDKYFYLENKKCAIAYRTSTHGVGHIYYKPIIICEHLEIHDDNYQHQSWSIVNIVHKYYKGYVKPFVDKCVSNIAKCINEATDRIYNQYQVVNFMHISNHTCELIQDRVLAQFKCPTINNQIFGYANKLTDEYTQKAIKAFFTDYNNRLNTTSFVDLYKAMIICD